MEIEEHINKLKIAYQAFSEIEGLSEMTVCDLAKAAHEQWALDQRTKFIQEEREKYGTAKDRGTASWRDEPATDSQKNYLRKRGIAIADDITKGQASDLIEKLGRGDR